MGLVVGDVIAAQDELQGVPQAVFIHDVGDGLPGFGAHDAQTDPAVVEPPQQLMSAGEQGGLVLLAGLGHL